LFTLSFKIRVLASIDLKAPGIRNIHGTVAIITLIHMVTTTLDCVIATATSEYVDVTVALDHIVSTMTLDTSVDFNTVSPRFKGPNLDDLGFNGPNFWAGLFRKYRTSRVEAQKFR
jgi:hypothetical protein